jgi:DNA polymerase-4
LAHHFGKQGERLFRIIQGTYNSPVRPNRTRKSVGVERTYFKDLDSLQAQLERIDELGAELFKRIDKAGVYPRTITLKVRSHQFKTIQRQRTFPEPLVSKNELVNAAVMLLHSPEPPFTLVRLLGLSGSLLQPKNTWFASQLVLPFPEQ